MEKKKHAPNKPAAYRGNPGQGVTGEPFPLGVYPVFDDDLPRDSTFDNFTAPDLRDMHPYPRGLE